MPAADRVTFAGSGKRTRGAGRASCPQTQIQLHVAALELKSCNGPGPAFLVCGAARQGVCTTVPRTLSRTWIAFNAMIRTQNSAANRWDAIH